MCLLQGPGGHTGSPGDRGCCLHLEATNPFCYGPNPATFSQLEQMAALGSMPPSPYPGTGHHPMPSPHPQAQLRVPSPYWSVPAPPAPAWPSQAALWGHGERESCYGHEWVSPTLPWHWAVAAMAQAEPGPVRLQEQCVQHHFHPPNS